jgi:TP901 family phage tail tape measure protein
MSDVTAGNLIVNIVAKLGDFKQQMTEAQGSVGDLAKKVEDNKARIQASGALIAGVGATISAGLGLATASSIEFNEKLANIQTLMPDRVDRVLELKDAIQDMAVTVGKSTSDLADGAYQVVSAFGDSADTVKILEISAKGATAGVATTTDAINLLSAVTKGYGDTSAEAVQYVSDMAFQTVKLGQTTFPELAASMGKVIPIAEAMNVTQEEAFNVMATLTGVTGKAAEVSTQFRGGLQALMAPTADTTALFEKMGIESGKALVEQVGMKGAILTLVKAAEDSGQPLQKYISSIEGQTFALALAGSQSDVYDKKLIEMAKSAGMTEEAFLAQAEGINSAGFALKQMKQSVTGLIQTIGDKLTPVVEVLSDVMRVVVSHVTEFMKEHPNLSAGLVAVGAALGVIATVLGGLLLTLPTIMAGFTAISALFAPVAGPLIIGIAAVTAAIFLIASNWDLVSNTIRTAWVEVIQPILGFMVTAFNFIWLTVKDVFGWVYDKITGVIKSVWDALSPFIDAFISGFNAVWEIVETVFTAIWNFIANPKTGVFARIYDAFAWLLEKLGIDMPTAEEIFGNLELAALSVGDAIETKWNSVKDTFNNNMEEATAKHAEEKDKIVDKEITANDILEMDLKDTNDNIEADTIETNDNIEADAKETRDVMSDYDRQEFADSVQAMLEEDKAAEDEKKNYHIQSFDEIVAEIKQEYSGAGGLLDDMELEHAATMKLLGQDYEAYLNDVIKAKTPTAFQLAFDEVVTRFGQAVDNMGSVLSSSLWEGNSLGDAFKAVGESLKSSLKNALTDVTGDIFNGFIKSIKDKLLSSGITDTFTSLFSSAGSAISNIVGSAASAITGGGGSSVVGAAGAAAGGGSSVIGAIGAGAIAVAPIAALFAVGYGVSKIFDWLNGDRNAENAEARAAGRNDIGTLLAALKQYGHFGWTKEQMEAAVQKIDMDERRGTITREQARSQVYRFKRMYSALLGAQLLQANPDAFVPGLSVNDIMAKGGELGAFNAFSTITRYHTGGIIEGLLGQERVIKALAGEEVITRNDPRHSLNFGGGIQVVITGNNINSELDMNRLGDLAARQIMTQLKLQTKL